MGAIAGGIDLRGKGRITRAFLEAASACMNRSCQPVESWFQAADGGLIARQQWRPAGQEASCHAGTEDDSLHVVLDGEIFNRTELIQELRASGRAPRSGSDAELILRLYQDKHDSFALGLRGSFTCAVFEPRKGRLVLARDHLGTRPLKFFEKDGLILFASEARALLTHEDVSGRFDIPSLGHFLTFGFMPSPFTGLTLVSKVPPGYILVADRAGVNLVRYWRPRIEPDHEEMDDERALGLMEDAIRHTIRQNLGTPSRTGLLLDGTLATTTLAWATSRLAGAALPVYDVIPPGSETHPDRPGHRIADALGLEYNVVQVPPTPMDRLPCIANAMDEPLADPAAVGAFEAFACLKDHIQTVILAEGLEALLGGYRRYHHDIRDRGPGFLPRSLFRALGRFWPQSLPFGNSIALFSQRPSIRFLMRDQIFHEEEKKILLGDRGGAFLSDQPGLLLFRFWFRGSDKLTRPERFRLADLVSRLPDNTLTRLDQCSHPHGITPRLPLLVPELVRAAGMLPSRMKAPAHPRDHFLYRLMARDLPEDVHPPAPRRIPPASWADGDLHDFTREILTDPSVARRGLLRPAAIKAVLRETGRHAALRRHALLMLELWRRSLEKIPTIT